MLLISCALNIYLELYDPFKQYNTNRSIFFLATLHATVLRSAFTVNKCYSQHVFSILHVCLTDYDELMSNERIIL